MTKYAELVSEMYVVQFLLQNTVDAAPALAWFEKEQGGYIAHVSGVQVELHWEHSVIGSRVVLSFARSMERVSIGEPHAATLSGKYRNGDQRRMAEMMRSLAAAVASQCANREVQPVEVKERIKNSIFRQVLFQERDPPVQERDQPASHGMRPA